MQNHFLAAHGDLLDDALLYGEGILHSQLAGHGAERPPQLPLCVIGFD